VCVSGLAILVLTDRVGGGGSEQKSGQHSPSRPLLGDVLVLIGATLYAGCNVLQEKLLGERKGHVCVCAYARGREGLAPLTTTLSSLSECHFSNAHMPPDRPFLPSSHSATPPPHTPLTRQGRRTCLSCWACWASLAACGAQCKGSRSSWDSCWRGDVGTWVLCCPSWALELLCSPSTRETLGRAGVG
jgi:hypothetical protein